MSKDVFDNDLDVHLCEEEQFKCTECDQPIEQEGLCNKRDCFNASKL